VGKEGGNGSCRARRPLGTGGRREEADIFRRLATKEEAAAVDAPIAEAQSLSSANEGLRLIEETFDRLALIGERAKDEQVLAEALRLAQGMIARLALVGEALGPISAHEPG
jgi:hypothetical protein